MTLNLWTCFSVAKVGSALMELLHSLEALKVEGLQNRVEASSHSSRSPHSIKTINNNRVCMLTYQIWNRPHGKPGHRQLFCFYSGIMECSHAVTTRTLDLSENSHLWLCFCWQFPCHIKAWELQMHISICSQLLLRHPQNLRLEHHPLAKLGHL